MRRDAISRSKTNARSHNMEDGRDFWKPVKAAGCRGTVKTFLCSLAAWSVLMRRAVPGKNDRKRRFSVAARKGR
jgi:hypothetical protein